MFLPSRGALRRLRPVASALAFLAGAIGAIAHEGHDHGAPPPVTFTTTHPRVAVQSDAYELVGILQGDRLSLTLDRFASNEPVTGAGIAVTVGDEDVQASPSPDGTYSVASSKFAGEGPLELVFAVTAPSGDDLLIGTLQLPAKAVAAGPTPARASPLPALHLAPSLRVGTVDIDTPYVIAGVALALGFLLGLAMRSRSRLVPATGLGVLLLVATTSYALSQEGKSTPAAENPRRLSDGTLFVPKPSQRLLAIRTTVAKPEAAAKAVTLTGRVIADPNRGGMVQSITGGRVIALEKGLPSVGQAVRKGEVLVRVERALPPEERVNLSERSAEIEQLIAVAEGKLRRVRQLAERGITAQGQLIDAETELEGLRRRREIISSTRNEPEDLTAPADGVISAARVVPGQVVQAQDVLFQIVDPSGLWVEALAYGDLDPAKMTGASAVTADGVALRLALRGSSRALQQQATVVQFGVENPPGNLAVGQPVTVIAQNGAQVNGILLSRDAVVRGGNGEALVWRHTDPERFEAKPVRAEAFDATRLVVVSGVAEGDRVVTRGAELINQVR